MKTAHIMVDLETMSTRPDAAIVSIGAVAFNSERIMDSFYVRVDLQSCIDAGLRVDGETVYWWLKQSREAREALEYHRLDIREALEKFSSWRRDYLLQGLWGNGASFDNAILSTAHRKLDLPQTPYFIDRCFRTVKSLFPKVDVPDEGTIHDALSDAAWQARYMIELAKNHQEVKLLLGG